MNLKYSFILQFDFKVDKDAFYELANYTVERIFRLYLAYFFCTQWVWILYQVAFEFFTPKLP